MPKATLDLEAGALTEELFQFLLDGLPPQELDELEVERRFAETRGLASEPTTLGVSLVLTSSMVVAICRLVARWLEQQRQDSQMKLVLRAYGHSEEAGKALTRLAEEHAKLAIEYKLSEGYLAKRMQRTKSTEG